jgi:spermidine synthase
VEFKDMKQEPNKWLYDLVNPYFMQLHSIKDIVYSGKTRFQSVEIIDTNSFGRCLVLDGKIQSSEVDEFIYHEALVHPSMVGHLHPQTVFIAGGGEGATLREVLAHRTVNRVVMIDIDKEAVDICRNFLPSWHQGCFEDSRLELLHLDARKYLAECAEKFDVIIIDITDPLKGSPSSLLYTQQFYHLAQQRLNPEGLLSVQAESCDWGESYIFTAINYTLHTVFPVVSSYQAYIPSFGSVWGFAIACPQQFNPLLLSAEEVDRRISMQVNKNLRFYDGFTHQGMFSLPKFLREEIGKEKKLITDDNPLFLY